MTLRVYRNEATMMCMRKCLLMMVIGLSPSAWALEGIPLSPSGERERDAPLFQKVAASESGVVFNHRINYEHKYRALYHSSMSCGGVAIGDVNGDLLPDIFITKGSGPNGLFINLGDFRFENRATQAGVDGGEAWSSGAAMADVDNDGDLDIYVANYDSPNQLFINDGKGSFVDYAPRAGLDVADASLMPAFCDYDRDGDLDMYLVTFRLYWLEGRPENLKSRLVQSGELVPFPPHDRYFGFAETDKVGPYENWSFSPVGRPDYFFRNNGDGSFSEISKDVGIGSHKEHGNSVTWWDYNADGWMDVYVANDFADPDRLYENQRDGTFKEVMRQASPHTPWYSMGAGSGDLNGDGIEDLLVTDMAATTHYTSKMNMGDMTRFQHHLDTAEPRQFMRNALFLGTGSARLMEAANLAGLAKSDWSWAVHIFDADGDGRNDVFISNGMVRDFMNSDLKPAGDVGAFAKKSDFDIFLESPERREANLAFKGLGDLKFMPVAKEWGLDFVGMTYGVARGDLDGDGDYDLVMCNMEDDVHVYRNASTGNSRIGFRLRGDRVNTFGLGAVVSVETATGRQTQVVNPHQGFASSNQPVVYFGLGGEKQVLSAHITWPDNTVQELGPLTAGRTYVVRQEGEKAVASVARKTLFRPSTNLAFAKHKERFYDDFIDQPLLPNKLSYNGPGFAIGDADGDGRDDIFLGGAHGASGEVHLQQPGGTFKWKSNFSIGKAKSSEDMGSLFLDVDGDGDLDLYVVSGSVEQSAGSEAYRDRIYLNDGKGKFTIGTEGRLPDIRDSGSVVVAADYDRDGDLDLFVGSRVIPQRYPLPPSSRLLRNDEGTFTDVSLSVAPSLHEIGLVTSAIWSDANNDGWIDLLVTTEWGPVKFFRNEQGGSLRELTSEAGLADYPGWWNGLAARDVDNDGDMDYLATNSGLNTKYKASANKPAVIFYGDFSGSGKANCVEASFEGDRLLPHRGRSCSSGAMPFILDKFKTYHDFALASLQDVYTPRKLDQSLKREATYLQYALLLNSGAGAFKVQPLPRDAQTSIGWGVVLTEVNGDGFADAVIAQNFFHPQRETPRLGGGLGVLLMGNGDGTFRHAWCSESGIDMPMDARGLGIIDVNQDQRPDLVFSVNQQPMQTFVNQSDGLKPLSVRLRQSGANQNAVGARVTVHVDGLLPQTAEVQAGGSYLSQSTSTLYFGGGETGQVALITVRWPNGEVTEHTNPPHILGRIEITR